MDLYSRALEIKDEIITHRRYLHQNPEVGLNMPKAADYIKNTLKHYDIEPRDCGFGVTASLGVGSPVILLRADMDALPMAEESGEAFASLEKAAHTCGHDLHAAMLLGAAAILKEHESELCGTVKLMFQPAEETLEGCRNMIDHGVPSEPKVDAAFAFHVGAGKMTPGAFMYNPGGVMMFASDSFRIDIAGKGGHGAYPHLTVDPIRIGVHIYSALESLIAKEAPSTSRCTLTVGRFTGGEAGNIIPSSAVLEGSLRTDSKDLRRKLTERITEIAEKTAETFKGQAKVTFKSSVPPLICDKEFTYKMKDYMEELNIPWKAPIDNVTSGASEDFALIAEAVPSVYMYLSAGFEDSRGDHLAHDPKVRFNEDVCPIGAAAFAHCAIRWLEENRK